MTEEQYLELRPLIGLVAFYTAGDGDLAEKMRKINQSSRKETQAGKPKN